MPVHVIDELKPVTNLKLVEDRRQMMAHCSLTDEKTLTNLFIFQSLADQTSNLRFASG